MSSIYRKAKDKVSPSPSIRRKKNASTGPNLEQPDDESLASVKTSNSLRSSISRRLSRKNKNQEGASKNPNATRGNKKSKRPVSLIEPLNSEELANSSSLRPTQSNPNEESDSQVQIHAPDRQDYEPITEQPSIAKSPLKEDPEEDQPEPTNYPPASNLVSELKQNSPATVKELETSPPRSPYGNSASTKSDSSLVPGYQQQVPLKPFGPFDSNNYGSMSTVSSPLPPPPPMSQIASTGHLPVNESVGNSNRMSRGSISSRLSDPNVANKQLNYPASVGPGPAYAIDNLASEPPIEPSELQPLLSPRNSIMSQDVAVPAEASWSLILLFSKIFEICYYKNPKTSGFVLIGLILSFCLFYLTLSNLDSLIMQALTSDFQSISVLNVNGDGLTFHVIGSVYLQYDNIQNLFYRYFMKLGAVIVGSISVIPNKSVKIFLTPKDIYSPPIHVLDIYPPEISINTVDKSILEIDFISKAELAELGIVKFANDFIELSHFKENINVQIQSIIDAKISSKFFNFETSELNVFMDYQVNPNQIFPNINVEDFSVTTSSSSENKLEATAVKNDELKVDSNIKVDAQLPLNFFLSPIEWDISLRDCNSDFIKWGEWKTNEINVDPYQPVSFKLESLIKETPREFLIQCEDGKLVLNQLAYKIINHEDSFIEFKINASENKNNQKNLPPWLYYVLQNVRSRFKFPLKGIKTGINLEDLLLDYLINDLSVDIPYKSQKKQVESHINGNFTLQIQLPPNSFQVDIGQPKVRAHFNIRDEKEVLIYGELNQESGIAISKIENDQLYENIFFDVELGNMEVDQLNPAKIGYLVNQIINDAQVEELFIDVFIDELEIDLPFLQSTFKDLNFSNIKIPYKQTSKQVHEMRYIDGILSGLNVSVNDILYEKSTAEELTFKMDVDIYNPTNITLEIPKETLSVDVISNGTRIGSVGCADLFILKKEWVNSILEIRLNPKDDLDKISLERLVSEFILGIKEIKIGAQGGKVKHNKPLGQLLSQLTIEDVQIPDIYIEPPQSKDPEISEVSKHKSPFLIESTIHILNSEVELTIYNPISNSDILVHLQQAEAQYKGEILGHLAQLQTLKVSPGIYKTPRMPLKINNGIGMDILRKAINGQLDVEVIAVFDITLDNYSMQLFYEGLGLTSNIKL